MHLERPAISYESTSLVRIEQNCRAHRRAGACCQAIAEVPAAGAVPSEVVGGGLARWTHGDSEPLQLAVEELNAAEVCGVSRLVVGRFSTVPAARVGCSFAIASHRATRFMLHARLARAAHLPR